MPMSRSTVSLNFGQGIDTKSDPKQVVPTKLITLQNGIFTNQFRVSKRNGYDAMTLNILGDSIISNPTMVKSYRNELVCAGQGSNGNRLFSYSSDLGKWIDKGKYISVAVNKTEVVSPNLAYSAGTAVSPSQILGAANSSAAYIASTIVYGYEQQTTNPGFPAAIPVYYEAVDSITGTKIAGAQINSSYGTIFGYSKVVSLGTSLFAIFYVSDTGAPAPKLCYQTISVTSSGVVLGSEVQLQALDHSNPYVYDVVTTSGGAFLAIGSGTSVYLYTINTSGVASSATTVTPTLTTSIIIVSLDSAGTNAWIYIHGSGTIKYAIYNASTISLVLAFTVAQNSLSNINQLAAIATNSTTQTLYVSSVSDVSSSLTIGVFYPEITKQTGIPQSGSISPNANVSTFINGLNIYSKPFTVGPASYIGCVSYSQNQSTGFIVDLSDATAIAKFLPGSAEGIFSQGYNTSGTSHVPPAPVAVRYSSFLSPVITMSSTLVGFSSGSAIQISTITPSSSSNLAAYPASETTGAQMGVVLSSFDFNHIDSYQSIIQQDTLLLNGGIVMEYDSAQTSELQYNTDADGVSLKGATTTGNLGTGKYAYYVVYSWVDSLGNLYQSSPSPAAVINFSSGTTNKVTIGFNPLTVTMKSNVSINIYRTIANGTIAYLIASLNNSSNGWGTGTTTYVDTILDSEIQSNPQLYTQGGAIVPNVAPPPAMIMWINNNRAWVFDSENPETTSEYSKTASNGTGVSFSTGLLEYLISYQDGVVTGVSPMDEKTVVLKQHGLGYFIGDGLNDDGLTGSSLSQFQRVPSITGCSNSKSVILYNDGILFNASNSKGIYKINRGVGVSYFGYDVEAFNQQYIQSSFRAPNKTQIRFLSSTANESILYDYVMNQWSIFTNHAGLSSDQFNGLYVYVRTDGNIYLEDQSSFLDASTKYALFAQTAWIKASSIQNFERVRRFEILGDYSCASSDSSYGAQISFAYDFIPSFTNTSAFLFSPNSNVSTPFQERVFTPRQKCDSIQVQIAEIPTGANGEYIDFTDLGMEISSKTGLNKLPAIRSVG